MALKKKQIKARSLALMAYACNPSNSGVSDQEDHGSKLALANSSETLILKKPYTKKGCGVAQGIGPDFKHQY
jgi:hypothetical protein